VTHAFGVVCVYSRFYNIMEVPALPWLAKIVWASAGECASEIYLGCMHKINMMCSIVICVSVPKHRP
jgi:hypothetical protein